MRDIHDLPRRAAGSAFKAQCDVAGARRELLRAYERLELARQMLSAHKAGLAFLPQTAATAPLPGQPPG